MFTFGDVARKDVMVSMIAHMSPHSSGFILLIITTAISPKATSGTNQKLERLTTVERAAQ